MISVCSAPLDWPRGMEEVIAQRRLGRDALEASGEARARALTGPFRALIHTGDARRHPGQARHPALVPSHRRSASHGHRLRGGSGAHVGWLFRPPPLQGRPVPACGGRVEQRRIAWRTAYFCLACWWPMGLVDWSWREPGSSMLLLPHEHAAEGPYARTRVLI